MKKFKFPIGVELTGIPCRPYDDHPDYDTEVHDWEARDRAISASYARGCDAKDKLAAQLDKRGIKPFGGVHVDSHCLEAASPILHTKAEAKDYFQTVRHLMGKMGLHAHNEKVVCGGGHIHIGVGKGIAHKRLALEIIRDVCNRPYLPWVFTEPSEEGSADNFVASIDYADGDVKRVINGESVVFENDVAWNYHHHRAHRAQVLWGDYKDARKRMEYWGGKDFSVCYHSGMGTVELRFFESAETWREQWDHIKFTQRYVAQIQRNLRRREYVRVTPLTREQIKGYGMNLAIEQFETLLNELELPIDRYSRYIERNLRGRWEPGFNRT